MVAVGNTVDSAVAVDELLRPSSFGVDAVGDDNGGSVVVDRRAIVDAHDHDTVVAAVRRQGSNNTLLQQHVDVAVAQDTARR